MTPPAPADLVLTGGHLFTADPAMPRAEAVAVSGGRIAAVGRARDVAAAIGPRTRVVRLDGRMLVPGFGDAHIHSMSAGLARVTCDLYDVEGLEAYQASIAEWAAAHPGDAWVTGEGWSMDDFPGGNPRREDLDKAVPYRPAFLWSRDGHTGWVNSRALSMAGIDAATPDPPGGLIVRDHDGSPAGALHEDAVDAVLALLPPDSPADREAAILHSQAYLHGLGVTAWQEMSVGPEELNAWVAVAGRGELTARVVGALLLDRHGPGDAIDELVALRARGSAGRFRASHVKLFQDGIIENFTAAMLDPYLDGGGRPTDNRGSAVVPPEQLRDDIVRLDALGFHLHVHVIGDRAVRETLDGIEAARRANGRTANRHQLAHIQVIHPADIPRFAALGVIANAQPYWACHEGQMERLTIPFLGAERATWQYPFRSLVDAGATLAMGSDWRVSTPNPLREIEVAVTRVSDRHRGEREPFLPSERLDLATALTAFTLGSAIANGLDANTGSITAGKLADLAVIDRDLFVPDAGPIGDARVLLTLVEGAAVFEDPALAD